MRRGLTRKKLDLRRDQRGDQLARIAADGLEGDLAHRAFPQGGDDRLDPRLVVTRRIGLARG